MPVESPLFCFLSLSISLSLSLFLPLSLSLSISVHLHNTFLSKGGYSKLRDEANRLKQAKRQLGPRLGGLLEKRFILLLQLVQGQQLLADKNAAVSRRLAQHQKTRVVGQPQVKRTHGKRHLKGGAPSFMSRHGIFFRVAVALFAFNAVQRPALGFVVGKSARSGL